MIESRPPRGDRRLPRAVRDAETLSGFLEDAAHYRGGHAPVVYRPESEAEIASVLERHARVLAVGAQSSLTGGATPFGDALISTERLTGLDVVNNRVRAGAGVPLTDLAAALTQTTAWYPPVPTFAGATVGGVVSTNAAGAATFKYGSTRAWVEALTVVLATGEVVDLERGVHRAGPDGIAFRLSRGVVKVRSPRYAMPDVAKLSAGYFARPEMDAIDLFIGAEGTLGIVTEATLRLDPVRPASCLAFVTFATAAEGVRCAAALREAAHLAHRIPGQGIDVSAIEHMDARCLAILRDAQVDRIEGVTIAVEARLALLVAIDLAPETSAARAYDDLGAAGDSMLGRFAELVENHGALGAVDIAVPGDRQRAAQLLRVREAVPTLVNQRVREAARQFDSRIEKVAADVIVPFSALAEHLAFIEAEFSARLLDGATWGHLSDGNLHPNVMARSVAELERGREAMLAIGRDAIRRGGAPLAEHGVGRNATKQQLLRELYGADAIEDMRAIKRALDPDWKLADGVIFSR